MIQRDYKADLKTAHEEISKMEKEIAALQEFRGGIIGLLASRGKILKAPEKIIQDMMEQIAELREVVQEMEEQIEPFKVGAVAGLG